MEKLQSHLESLQEVFPGRVKSAFRVDRSGTLFCGFEISCEPMFREWAMRKVAEIVGNDYIVGYLPNQELIIIDELMILK